MTDYPSGQLGPAHTRSNRSWLALRILLAGLIAAHGWARLLAGGVAPFGGWLQSQGIPLGPVIAAAITAVEILGSVLFAAGRLVFPLSLGFAGIYIVGIILVHLPEGWFVVGLGRNGAEYSVLLVACLILVGLQHRSPRGARR
ncbi:MAG: DoxX family protein [Candidatus Eisenbacteria bacterium]|nr:DoxX family protein [Candidatus Eisenbacteria bacterium]